MSVNNNIERESPAQASGEKVIPPSRSSRKRSIIIFVVVSAINAGLVVLLATQLLTPRQGLPQSNSNMIGDIPSPLIGKSTPDFTLPALNGNAATVHLAAFKGKPIIINFWAAWCDPCNQEALFLEKTWMNTLQPQGVVLIGIDGAEARSNALDFLHKYGITYTNVKDTAVGETAVNYGTTGNPETFFIDRHGIVVARWTGALTKQALTYEMAKMHLN